MYSMTAVAMLGFVTRGCVCQDARKGLIERIGALLQTKAQRVPLMTFAALRAQAIAHQSRAVIADALGRFDHAQGRAFTHADAPVEHAIDGCGTYPGSFGH